MLDNNEVSVRFNNRDEIEVTQTNDGMFHTLDIRLDRGDEQLSLVKLEESDEFGLRLIAYPTPDTNSEQLFEISLHNYRNENPITLTNKEREIAIEALSDIYLESYETTESIILNGYIGVNNLSDSDLLENLGLDLQEFRDTYGVDNS